MKISLLSSAVILATLLSTVTVRVFASDCVPEILYFHVFDSETDAPVGYEPVNSIIDADNVQVCLPFSGLVNIEAVATECVSAVNLEITRPNGAYLKCTASSVVRLRNCCQVLKSS